MIIKNASIYTEDHTFVNGNAVVENGRFVSFSDFSEQDAQIVDAQGLYMIPGLVDIHFHGCMGADMCDGTKEALDIITRYEASIGVTSVCPATMTIAKDELLNVMKNASDYAYNGGAHLVGINMEGPFISASKKGAQAEENILHCDYEYFCRLQKAAKGLIKLVDLAPEEPGAMEFIEKAKDEVVISLAHTASDYDTAKEAIQRGASHATHLYNAMPPLNHRNPGVIGAVRDSETCHAELICDGVHIHPSVIRATFAMFGAKRMILISDSMRATGLDDGDYTLGGQPVKVKGNLATLHDGTIAGSATNLMDCVLQQIQKHKASGLVVFLQWKTLCSNYCRSCFYSCICCFIIRMAITFRCTCCSWKRYCWSGCCRSRYLCIPQPTADPYRITSRTEQCILV